MVIPNSICFIARVRTRERGTYDFNWIDFMSVFILSGHKWAFKKVLIKSRALSRTCARRYPVIVRPPFKREYLRDIKNIVIVLFLL